jgi:hypothetical protein
MSRPSLLTACSLALLLATALLLPLRLGAQAPEGIVVHGNWVIEVRDSDGTLRQRREFRNALTEFGQQDLVALLGRTFALTYWRVVVRATAGTCHADTDFCQIRESADGFGGIFASDNLTVTPGALQLTLAGTFTASAAGTLSAVETLLARDASIPGPFTQTGLGPAVFVEANQSVSVSVTFTFE